MTLEPVTLPCAQWFGKNLLFSRKQTRHCGAGRHATSSLRRLWLTAARADSGGCVAAATTAEFQLFPFWNLLSWPSRSRCGVFDFTHTAEGNGGALPQAELLHSELTHGRRRRSRDGGQ